MILERFEVPGLAHYSYLLGSQGQAVVIDPKRDVDTYLSYARAKDLIISHVLETHIHADYVSGTQALAAATGAKLWVSGHDEGQEYRYRYGDQRFCDGEELVLGDLRLVAIYTPGHTPEHLSFLVYEQSRCGQPMALFSGDFVFVGSLGRPDLLGADAKRKLAASLYQSVHTKIADLPDGVEIHPAHGAGSLCGAGMSQRPQSTLGYERFCNVFLCGYDEEQFVDCILSSVPEFPDYYRRMKKINAEGPVVLKGLPGDSALGPDEFRAKLDRLDAVLIDLRRPEAFGGAHIPGAFNIGAGQNLSMWAAWVVPYDHPILLVGDADTDLEQSRRSLIRVGFDEIEGYLKGGMTAWIEAGLEQAHIPQISVLELANRLDSSDQVTVLDVRSPKEWRDGHIHDAIHIPGGELPKRVNELPSDSKLHVICGSGYRSSVATSVLERAGYGHLVNVVGGMTAWNRRGLSSVKE
jgi:hydroxyacylglutathione hydrolase